ncbi:MAG: hypothetical protein KBT03_09585 [Bacteroidales bacterium]|nr:hypothetical protein [Candidatus Scybalousia scybalohippi]
MASSSTDIKDLKFNFGKKQVLDTNVGNMNVGDFAIVTDRVIPLAPTTDGDYVLRVVDGVASWVLVS